MQISSLDNNSHDTVNSNLSHNLQAKDRTDLLRKQMDYNLFVSLAF